MIDRNGVSILSDRLSAKNKIYFLEHMNSDDDKIWLLNEILEDEKYKESKLTFSVLAKCVAPNSGIEKINQVGAKKWEIINNNFTRKLVEYLAEKNILEIKALDDEIVVRCPKNAREYIDI